MSFCVVVLLTLKYLLCLSGLYSGLCRMGAGADFSLSMFVSREFPMPFFVGMTRISMSLSSISISVL